MKRVTISKESDLEAELERRVRLLGGGTRKWVSPGHVGVPDRIVFHPGIAPEVWFVETKKLDGDPRTTQEREINWLRSVGCKVYVINTVPALADFISDMKAEILRRSA